MKADRLFSLFALSTALAALGHSFWVQSQADAKAREALRQRETELVRAATPKVIEVLENMSSEGFDAAKFKPVTFEELAAPLVKIVTGFAEPATIEP